MLVLEARDLDRLRAVARRLYSETRLTGDEMRDLAHRISGVVGAAVPLEEK